MPVLYDYELSADAYKVRLLMSLLGVPYEKCAVDVFPGREHLSPDFLELTPRGTVPVLVDGDLVLGDAEAILCHLAATYDARRAWLPAAGAAYAETMAWLFFAARELSVAEEARLESMLQLRAGRADAAGKARAAFRILEQRLAEQSFRGHDFLVGQRPTIADVACFPAVALSIDFGMTLEDFPKLRLWTRRIRRLPGFVAMPGIPEYL
jgi:glutathione S-transferase